MNQSYFHKLSSSLTPEKNKQNNITQLSLNNTKQIRDSINYKKGDSLLNMLIQQQQQAIQSARQYSNERSIKTSPQEISSYLQKQTAIVSSSLSYAKGSTEQLQMGNTQFDRLLNKNTSLLMKIQELEQNNSLLQMKCQSYRKQDVLVKQENRTCDMKLLLQANENRILKELINRQNYLMHIPSVLQTLSLVK